MKKLTVIALAVLAIAGCQQKGGDEPVLGKINVEPVITKATEVNFEEGDKVGLTIVAENSAENYAENACMTYSFSPTVPSECAYSISAKRPLYST